MNSQRVPENVRLVQNAPQTISIEGEAYTVHYMNIPQDPKKNPKHVLPWIAFTLYVKDSSGRMHPAESMKTPPKEEPPGLDEFGSTPEEAFSNFERKLRELKASEKP